MDIIEKNIQSFIKKTRYYDCIINFEGRNKSVFLFKKDGSGMVRVFSNEMDNYGFISDLFVKKENRNNNIGNELLSIAEKVIIKMNLLFAELRVSKGEWMEDWYEHHGYEYFFYEDGYSFMLKKLL